MPNTKEIKGRIKSIRDTQKITNAMYMISSTKMRKAKNELDRTRPYFEALKNEITRLLEINGKIKSRYIEVEGEDRPKEDLICGCLVITADKGLAGAYNQNVTKAAMAFLQEHKGAKLFVVGEYGRRFFTHKKVPIVQSFLYTAQNPTLQRAREISAMMLGMFERDEIQRVYCIYTDLQNGIGEEAKVSRIVPFYRSRFLDTQEEIIKDESFEIVPNPTTVLETGVRSYVTGFIYGALIDSFCSEQNARMTAMSSANDNAEKMLAQLSVQYNRVRQAAITQEITEVSAGAKAQKKKRMKEIAKYAER